MFKKWNKMTYFGIYQKRKYIAEYLTEDPGSSLNTSQKLNYSVNQSSPSVCSGTWDNFNNGLHI